MERPDNVSEQDQALERLRHLRITCNEREFLRCVGTGDLEVVKLMLSAGIRPSARDDAGDPAIVIAAMGGHDEVVDCLLNAGVSTAALVEGLRKKTKRKDMWDKLASVSAIATVISGLLIAGVGGLFTYFYNQAQLKLSGEQVKRDTAVKDVDAVDKMLPYLSGEDQNAKKTALLALSALTDTTFASQLAQLYPSEGSTSAVIAMATAPASSPEDRRVALEATAKLLEANRQWIVKVTSDTKSGSYFGSGFLDASGRVITADDIVEDDNSHLALAPNAIHVETASREELVAMKIEIDKNKHLANVLLEKPQRGGLKPRAETPLAGERIVAFGFLQEAADVVPFVGTIVAVQPDRLDVTYSTGKKTLSGAGGGPVFSSNGNVIGLVYHNEGRGVHEVIRVSPE
jgi:hypothetical protein